MTIEQHINELGQRSDLTPQDYFNFWVENTALRRNISVADVLSLGIVAQEGMSYTGDYLNGKEQLFD